MDFDLKQHTILLTVAGSRAYGTHRPDSDIDVKGVCIPPEEYRLGYLHRFEQADKPSHMHKFIEHMTDDEKEIIKETKLEGSVYDIRKFFKLAADCNPNILDVLFCRDSEVRITTLVGEKLREHAKDFLSTKARFTFAGYAHAQLKRIKTHRKYLLNPPTHAPTRKEYGIPQDVTKDKMSGALAAVRKQLDSWEIDFGEMSQGDKIYIQNQINLFLAEQKLSRDEKFAAAARMIGYSENFVELLKKESQYRQASQQYKQYQEWKKSRNPERAALEAKYGYDCYSDDTEFLTDHGWKKFDDIQENEKLATVYIGESFSHRKFGKMEYQIPTERFDGSFNGNMYHLYGYHIDTLVTPNHRMLIRKVERKSGKTFEWELCEASNLPDTFEIMMAPEPVTKKYKLPGILKNQPIKEMTFMRLLGWYLSDGTCSISNGKIKDIRISQKKGGRLCQSLTKFSKKYKKAANCSLYKYNISGNNNSFRKNDIIEYILSVRDKTIRETIYKECGHSKEKRIPFWVFSLSKSLKEVLLDAAVAGDGTIRSCGYNSIIYYSSSKLLANDIQELAMSCGFETSLYGPYKYEDDKCEMYQVHINKNAPRIKRLVRSKNVKKVAVQNQRFVCFSVPNGTLITRRNGHVGIHGNCKHGSHLVRLYRMCEEILEKGEVNVWRPDAKELLEIRNGGWTYEQLIEFADEQDAKMDELYKSSVLPKRANQHKLDKLCIELTKEFMS
jgi:predicted nucleotidyltransferase